MAVRSLARRVHTQQVSYISRTINYSDAAAATGQLIGYIPAGATLGTTKVQTTTAFNGTTSVTLSVGTTLTGTDLINATDVRTATARVDTVVPIAAVKTVFENTGDQAVYASVTFGGTVGTAGQATVTVSFEAIVG
jgi:hypothetical protein